MSTNIPEHMLLSDLLKATGYNCPSNLQGKTFKEATAGNQPTPDQPTPAKLYAFGTAEGVVYTRSIPDDFSTVNFKPVDFYAPAVTGLSKGTGQYYDSMILVKGSGGEGNKLYPRYEAGDLVI